MWVAIVAFWALIIWAVYVLVTKGVGRSGDTPYNDDPRPILDRRLAAGEIDIEEYRRLRDAVGSQPNSKINGSARASAGDRR